MDELGDAVPCLDDATTAGENPKNLTSICGGSGVHVKLREMEIQFTIPKSGIRLQHIRLDLEIEALSLGQIPGANRNSSVQEKLSQKKPERSSGRWTLSQKGRYMGFSAIS